MKKFRLLLILMLSLAVSSCSMLRNAKTRKNTRIVLEQFIEYSKANHPRYSEKESDYFLYVSLYKKSDISPNVSLNVQLRNRKAMDSMPESKVYIFNSTKVLLYEESKPTAIIKKIVKEVEYEDLKLPNNQVHYSDVMYWDVEFNEKNEVVRCTSGPKTDSVAYLKLVNNGLKLSKQFKNR